MTNDKFHTSLRYLGVAIGTANLIACLLLDTREWLVYFDPWFWRCIIFPTFVVALPALPFLLPRQPDAKTTEPPILLAAFGSLLLCCEALWFLMIAISTFCRDHLWNFYWPWEERGTEFVALNHFDLSEYFWVSFLGTQRPAEPFLRESLGLLLLTLHLLLVPFLTTVLVRRRTSIASWRVLLIAFVIQILLLLLIKIGLQNGFDLKYLVRLPEFALNF